jgi:hypothetical protein
LSRNAETRPDFYPHGYAAAAEFFSRNCFSDHFFWPRESGLIRPAGKRGQETMNIAVNRAAEYFRIILDNWKSSRRT